MPKTSSLIGGRNAAPLTPDQINRVIDTFSGLDSEASVRYAENERTVFRVMRDPVTQQQYGEVVFSRDVLPGPNIVNPNSSLDLMGVAAHELTHLYRWRNGQAIDPDDLELEHLDEALTSLQAISNFSELRPLQVRQLAADALERINLFMRDVLPAIRQHRQIPAALEPVVPTQNGEEE